jgi:hypothetical protein
MMRNIDLTRNDCSFFTVVKLGATYIERDLFKLRGYYCISFFTLSLNILLKHPQTSDSNFKKEASIFETSLNTKWALAI